jgi:hypothetical protein
VRAMIVVIVVVVVVMIVVIMIVAVVVRMRHPGLCLTERGRDQCVPPGPRPAG